MNEKKVKVLKTLVMQQLWDFENDRFFNRLSDYFGNNHDYDHDHDFSQNIFSIFIVLLVV